MGRLGAHVSIAGGLHHSIERALDLDLESFQIFTKNQRQWEAPPINEEERVLFLEGVKRAGIGPVISHDSYLINLASPKEGGFKRSVSAFTDEIVRASLLEIDFLVMHPGSHTGSGVKEGIRRISKGLDASFSKALKKLGEINRPLILLETMAGQGTGIGRTFEELLEIMEGSEIGGHLGICYDTCHAHAAGYDITIEDGYGSVMDRFDETLGLDNLKAFHLNDSIKGLGSNVDRHTGIGEGMLGIEPFSFLVNDRRFEEVPMVLETPGGEEGYRRDLAVLRE